MIASSFDYYFLRNMYEQLGFPSVANESYPDCGVIGLNTACDESRMLCLHENNTLMPSLTIYRDN